MFCKFSSINLPSMLGRRGWEYRSIANTLAILHVLSVFISFSCASVFLYNKMLNHLNMTNYKSIREEIFSIRTMLQAPNGIDLLAVEIRSQTYESETHKIFIRVIDGNGRIINESPDMHELLPAFMSSQMNDDPATRKYRTPSGSLFLLNSAPFINAEIIGNGRIQVALDISEDEILAKQFMVTLIVFSLLGLLFAIVSAIIIIRLVLCPLNEISEKIKNITESNLDMRLNVDLFPEEMKSLGHSFNSMLGRMESSFKKLTQYSENLAHELRTPLNNLMLEAEIALSRQRPPEEYKKVISSSMEEYDRLSLLIDRLLFLVRVDNNQLGHVINTIDVRSELENIVEFYSESIHDKGVTVSVVGTATLGADLVLFTRAVGNLFSNALKYTGQGGSITLTTIQRNNTLEVAVSDTGSGIDPVLLPKVFDRYFWIEATRNKDAKGTGLGLDIVKAIMKLHGGTVEIQSELGIGTTVKLLFPATR